MNFHPVTGGMRLWKSLKWKKPTHNFNGKRFFNKTPYNPKEVADGYMNLLYALWIFNKPERWPDKPLPSEKFSSKNMENGQMSWLGHSCIVAKLSDMIIVTDPVFNRPSPLPFAFAKPFQFQHTPGADDFDTIDVIVISHDHYDHLDYKSIVSLKSKTKYFLVPLWVKQHLLKWWVDESKITELNWEQTHTIWKIDFSLTPAQHFSGRHFFDQFKTLWWSWVIAAPEKKIFFSGDSWYFSWFKHIGKKYGPFDVVCMENGAYNEKWKPVHMMPFQSMQACIDLWAKNILPIHWCKFNLSNHVWHDPIEQYLELAKKSGIPLLHPMVGQIISIDDYDPQMWWKPFMPQ